MKKIINIFITIVLLFLFITTYNANTINSIDIDVYIDQNGNATITEVWDAYLENGTEGYRAYSNLGNSKISNLSVSDDRGSTYENIGMWDVSASFTDKYHKCGINYTYGGLEICWGISNYGNNKYTIKYDYSNIVKQYTDTQGIYLDFLNLDFPVKNAKVTIHSDVPFDLSNTKIWGFGFDGSAHFVDGAIVFKTTNELLDTEYITGLIRFESNLFTSDNYVNYSFDDDYDSAYSTVDDEEIDVKEEKDHKFITKFLSVILTLIHILIFPVTIVFMIFYLTRLKKNYDIYRFSYKNMIIPKEDEVNYYRDIPCNGDINLAYWICYQYKLVKDNDLRKGIIGAYFLKWIYNDDIKVIDSQRDELGLLKYSKVAFDLTNSFKEYSSSTESTLMSYLQKAAKENKILEENEFYKWSKENYSSYSTFYSKTIGDVRNYLIEKEYLYKPDSDVNKPLNEHEKKSASNTVSEEVNKYAEDIVGFKKFLLDFGNTQEKGYIEVKLFQEYMIFAALLGIADKVEKQFKKQYPDYVVRYEFDLSKVMNVASSCYTTYEKAYYKNEKARIGLSSSDSDGGFSHDYSGSDRSSGGGGSSYSSGGSSAGGSSGGGFR